MNIIKFRKANIDDVYNIVDLCNRCFNENTDRLKAKEIFEKTMNDKNNIYLIGEFDGKIISHTKITIVRTMFENIDSYALLNHVCVDPDYRRYNVATYMLDEIKRICINFKCNYIRLWSRIDREEAQSFYRKYGFTSDGLNFFSMEL